MSYDLTYEYYSKEFMGEPVSESDFPSLLKRAEEIVEEMTVYRLNPTSFLAMPSWIQTKVRDAICAEVEYLDANGGVDMDNSSDLQSASLGKFSYTRATTSTGGVQQSIYSPRAQRILAPTGLLYQGGRCL